MNTLAVFRAPRMLALLGLALLLLLPQRAFEHAGAAEPWARHVVDNTARGADGARLADFNGDGYPDIVCGWEESGLVRLYLHPGVEQVHRPWPMVTIARQASPEDAVAVDLDGDGRLEVVSCHEGSSRRVLIHRHDHQHPLLDPKGWSSSAPAPLRGPSWMFAVPLRLSRSRTALAIGSKGGNGSISLAMLRPHRATDDWSRADAWNVVKLRNAGWIMSLEAIDMDGDGDEDILYSDRKGERRGVGYLAQPSSPKPSDSTRAADWTDRRLGGQDHEVMFLDAAKNHIEVATRNGEILILHRTADGNWRHESLRNPPGVRLGKSIRRLADGRRWLTANTHADRGAGDRAAVWTTDAGGQWHPIDDTPRLKTDLIIPIDLDGDGDLDLLTCEERRNLGIVWYEQPGPHNR